MTLKLTSDRAQNSDECKVIKEKRKYFGDV